MERLQEQQQKHTHTHTYKSSSGRCNWSKHPRVHLGIKYLPQQQKDKGSLSKRNNSAFALIWVTKTDEPWDRYRPAHQAHTVCCAVCVNLRWLLPSSTTRGHCGSVPPPSPPFSNIHSPAPCCCRRMAEFPGSGEAEDLATEVVVDEMDGRRPGWACWGTRCFPCPNLWPPARPWPGSEVALPAPAPPRAVLVFLRGQRFWMCDTASSATIPSPAVMCSAAWTVNSWVSSAHRSDTRHSYTPSSSFFTLDRLRRWEIALPWTRTVWNEDREFSFLKR